MKISKLFILLFVFFVSVAQGETDNEMQIGLDASREQNSKEINKEKLTSKIKSIIIDEFIYEVYVLINSETLHCYSQGSKELGDDIIDLHDSFVDRELAQTKLDEFCKKWNLENINIREVLRLGWKAIENK